MATLSSIVYTDVQLANVYNLQFVTTASYTQANLAFAHANAAFAKANTGGGGGASNGKSIIISMIFGG